MNETIAMYILLGCACLMVPFMFLGTGPCDVWANIPCPDCKRTNCVDSNCQGDDTDA